MVICSLDALKKSSDKKEKGKEMEIFEMLQQAIFRSKKTGMMKFLVSILYLLARLILILITASAIICCF